MSALFNKLHARLGDLWWYSLMIFVACRTGDVIQAFIGLWLVPKYVGHGKLGAVLPLLQLTSFLTVPLGVVAIVFSKYVNTYATRGEYGKVKSFIRDVFKISFILFILCFAGAYLVMPFFYKRLRIASGSLTLLVLLCGLVGNLGSIIGSAQQGLKRFKTMSAMAIISAPIRLVTLLVAMPIRALSGYILGQTTPTATTSLLSVLDIHRILKPYSLDTSWRKDWKTILKYAWPIIINTTLSTFAATLVATVYRQRLPEIESSAHYMLSRFSDMAGFVGMSVVLVIFPLASEAYERKQESSRILISTLIIETVIFSLMAIVLAFAVPVLLSSVADWKIYTPYDDLMLIYTLTTAEGMILSTISTYEMACNRFGTTFLGLFFAISWAGFLVTFSGYNFFNGILPSNMITWMQSIKATSISRIAYYNFGYLIVQLISFAALLYLQKRKRHHKRTQIKTHHG